MLIKAQGHPINRMFLCLGNGCSAILAPFKSLNKSLLFYEVSASTINPPFVESVFCLLG